MNECRIVRQAEIGSLSPCLFIAIKRMKQREKEKRRQAAATAGFFLVKKMATG